MLVVSTITKLIERHLHEHERAVSLVSDHESTLLGCRERKLGGLIAQP